MKSIMPPKVQAKMRVCPGRTLRDEISKCPFVRLHVSLASLPTFLGGQCHCPHRGGCVQGTANEQRIENLEADSEGLVAWTVGKKSYEVFVPIEESGTTISWCLKVSMVSGSFR